MVAKPNVVTVDDWRGALEDLATREAEVSRQLEELAAARKRMPMVKVEKDYRFDGPKGELTLLDMFEGRSQLILYRFFFEEGVAGWPEAGCVGCTAWTDGVAALGLLHAHDVTFAMASPAPQHALRAYADRMQWRDLPWYSIKTDDFVSDFGATDWFALNVFLRDGDDIYRTYFLQDNTMVGYTGSVRSLLSITPYGGQIESEDVPDGWPQAPWEYWMRRHDEFHEPAPSAR